MKLNFKNFPSSLSSVEPTKTNLLVCLAVTASIATVGAYAMGWGGVSVGSFLVAAASGATMYLRVLRENRLLSSSLTETESQLVREASASRVLTAIRSLDGNTGLSPDARLASAARMATGYQASVVYKLRDSQGVLVPTNWNYEGQLEGLRDAFELVGSESPGAQAAQQGSAIVISGLEESGYPLPDWASAAGFKSGIVAPLTRDLDTIGVVYVLSTESDQPTIPDIEQLELVLGFASRDLDRSRTPITDDSSFEFRSTAAGQHSGQSSSPAKALRLPGFELLPETERVQLGSDSLSLSPTEFALLYALASTPQKTVSSEELMKSCWDASSRPADNAVDVAIFRLRKKLKKLEYGTSAIKTVRGRGYMFVPPVIEDPVIVSAD